MLYLSGSLNEQLHWLTSQHRSVSCCTSQQVLGHSQSAVSSQQREESMDSLGQQRQGDSLGGATILGMSRTPSTTSLCTCRICHLPSTDPANPLLAPCRCAGSIRYVHTACLQVSHILCEWLNQKLLSEMAGDAVKQQLQLSSVWNLSLPVSEAQTDQGWETAEECF